MKRAGLLIAVLVSGAAARAQDQTCPRGSDGCEEWLQMDRQLRSFLSGRLSAVDRQPLGEDRKFGVRSSFLEAQQEWARFRDAECQGRSAANTISARPAEELNYNCRSELTRERIRQIRSAEPGSVPDQSPFDVPYGPPIPVERAARAVEAVVAAAVKPPRSWKLAVSVVDPNGDQVFSYRMDQAPVAGAAVAYERARAAARHRRPTAAIYSEVETPNGAFVVVPASRGGTPLISGGRVVGAIGCSGGTDDQDWLACEAGAEAVR